MTDEPMTGDCFDEEHDPLSDCLEHYTKLQKEYDALKAKLADLEASQTRWVQCSERLPEKAGYYLTSARWVRWFQPDFLVWDGVVAWLENVPKFEL